MKKPLCKVAFIGAGYMTIEHVKAFKDIPEVKLVGIHSRTRSKAQLIASEYGIENVYNTINDLYYETKADLVVISVPELSTKDVVLEAFKFPWKCLIEKPVGYNLQEAEFIASYARNKNIVAYVALNRRHYSSTRYILEELNKINSKRYIYIQDQEDTISALKAGQPKVVVENWMYANSIHLIDYFSFFARGSITKIDNVVKWDKYNPSIVIAKIEFSSGDIGLYQAFWNMPSPWIVSVTTEESRFELKPIEFVSKQSYGNRLVENIKQHSWDEIFKPGLRRQAELAVLAASANIEKVDLPTLDDSLESMKLIYNIYS